MKLVACSDPHYDRVTAGVPRFAEVSAALHKTVDAAIELKADVWACLGDFFDPDCGPVAYRALLDIALGCQRLLAHKIPWILLAGNHDVVEDGLGTVTISPLIALEGGWVVERPRCIAVGKTWLICLPYTASSRGYDAAAELSFYLERAETDGYRTIVLSHLQLPGITPGSESSEMPRGREVRLPLDVAKRADLVLNGHYHRRQVYEGVQVVGSLARLTFGEEDSEPGYLVVDI